MTTHRSARQKGRNYEATITGLLRSYFGLTDEDIRPTPASINGQDIQRISSKAKLMLPFAFELKKQERLNIWDAIEQSEKNSDSQSAPVVIFSRNRTRSYITLRLDIFLYVWKMALPFFNMENFFKFLGEINEPE